MIKSIWGQIAVLLTIAVIPIAAIHIETQRQSLEIIYDVAEGIQASIDFERYMNLLKQHAKDHPESEARNKEAFHKLLEAKHAVQDFSTIKKDLIESLRNRTIVISFIVLFVSVLMGLLVARSIVNKYKVLIEENSSLIKRGEQLKSLKSWQKIARMLVHEFKTPITPIKMVASDLVSKHNKLSTEDYSSYLKDAQELVLTQVKSIEEMISSFTHFGKMPDTQRVECDLDGFLYEFKEIYGPILDQEISITSAIQTSAPIDKKLMRDLLYNLAKNAVEANPGENIHLAIDAGLSNNSIDLKISNKGKPIPESLVERLFEPYVTTKQGSNSNMGLGLSIVKKIALDHGGDIELTKNEEGIVTFLVTISV